MFNDELRLVCSEKRTSIYRNELQSTALGTALIPELISLIASYAVLADWLFDIDCGDLSMEYELSDDLTTATRSECGGGWYIQPASHPLSLCLPSGGIEIVTPSRGIMMIGVCRELSTLPLGGELRRVDDNRVYGVRSVGDVRPPPPKSDTAAYSQTEYSLRYHETGVVIRFDVDLATDSLLLTFLMPPPETKAANEFGANSVITVTSNCTRTPPQSPAQIRMKIPDIGACKPFVANYGPEMCMRFVDVPTAPPADALLVLDVDCTKPGVSRFLPLPNQTK